MRRVDSQAKSMATFDEFRVLIHSPPPNEGGCSHAELASLGSRDEAYCLDRQIVAESHRPAPDSRILADLKKQKLRVKEAIAAL